MKVLNWIRKEKELYFEGAKAQGKNKSIYEIVKKKKEMHGSFAAPPQTAEVMASGHDKLVRMTKA